MEIERDRILSTANSFFLAAKRSEEQRPLGNSQSEILLIPAVTSRAFACELFLKFILSKQGQIIKGHKLHDLYLKLNKQSQFEIATETDLSEEAFYSGLRGITDLFVEWRYVFEHGNV